MELENGGRSFTLVSPPVVRRCCSPEVDQISAAHTGTLSSTSQCNYPPSQNTQDADGAAARLVEGILKRKSFYFQQRTAKLDMRAIGRVDVERVVKDVDIDTLQVGQSQVDVRRG